MSFRKTLHFEMENVFKSNGSIDDNGTLIEAMHMR